MVAQKYWMRIGGVGIIVLVSWAVYISSKQMARNERIQSEVAELQNEAERIRRENETLSEKIGYFSSVDFRELEAKEKLGMKKKEEQVVVIKPRPESTETAPETEDTKPTTVTGIHNGSSNIEKWWRLFFENRNN